MYGPNAVLGWPMLYRYPPLFLCLFVPLALLPLRAAAAVWAALEVFLLGWLLRCWYRRYPLARPLAGLWVPALLLTPYVVKVIEMGNVQLLVVELACFALLLDRRPTLAGLLLGLAAAIKVWPAFLVPYLAFRERQRFAAKATAAACVFTIAPAAWLGWGETFHLLSQWYAQEKRINALLGDRWYPSQSLRGVMLRYLTRMNYSGLPDTHYRLVNLVSWPSVDVRLAWLVLALLLGLVSLILAGRCRDEAAAYSVFFCFLLVIQPNVAVSIYVTLLWPALVAGGVMADRAAPRTARWLFAIAAVSAALIPLPPGSELQRLEQVLGADFFAVLLPLTIALVAHSHARSSPSSNEVRGPETNREVAAGL